MKTLRIGSVVPVAASVVEAIRTAGEAALLENGQVVGATVKFPGVAPVEFRTSELAKLRDTLRNLPPRGETPAEIFAATCTRDVDGNVTGRFSYDKGARSLTLTPSDIAPLYAYLDSLEDAVIEEWPALVAKQLADAAEAEANGVAKRGRPKKAE